MEAVFIGRSWLVQAVRDWAASDSHYLFLTGQPGAGKSAAVDHLWGGDPVTGTTGVAVYRCRAGDRRSGDPVRFAESVAEQFSQTLPGFTDALMRVSTELSGRPGDIHIEGSASAETVHPHGSVVGVRISITNVSADEAFDRLVGRPLARLAPQPLPVVVIDALDEALTYRAHRTIAELVLDGMEGLPLRFVITSRHDDRVVVAKERIEDAASLDLISDAPDAEADLAEYADFRLRDLVTEDGERQALATQLAVVGAGSYLYVHHLTAELIAGRRVLADLDDVSVLPSGLEDLYGQFLRREVRPVGNAAAEERWRREFRPVLSLLVVAQEQGFSARQLAEMLDSTEQSVQDVIRVLRQYLLGASSGSWTLYHRSFAEFLLRGPDALVDAVEGHRRIAEYAFDEWADDWAACDDRYYVRHLPHHLMAALEGSRLTRAQARKLRDRLYVLATSEPYLAAQQVADPDREPHLTTISLALESSLGVGEYERVTRLTITLVRAQSVADAVTPVQAALDWGIDAGVAKARSYPEEISLLWHLLILTAVGLRDPDEASSVATVIGRSGFETVGEGWEPPMAMLLAPFMPVLNVEQARAIMGIADDFLLGYLALFLLEWFSPQFSIVPALWIDEAVLRARAFTEIISRLALTGRHAEVLPEFGDLVMDDYRQRQRQMDRSLGRESDATELKTYLLTPDVPDSVLVAEATRGNFATARQELTEKDSIYTFCTSGDAVLLGMVVDAVVNSGEAAEQLREAGEKEIARQPGVAWNLLHYTNYLMTVADPRVPELLDRIVELSHADDENDFLWEMHEGHIDAFHGRCDVGLQLAVVQALCAAGRTASAAAEAEVLRTSNPTEYIRALSYVYADETNETQAERVLESARQAAVTAPRGLASQAMLVLLDGDFNRLLTAVTGKLARAGGDALRIGSTTWSLLAWAAHLRDDQERAENLGHRATTAFSELPEDERSPRVKGRLVCNLLRAGLPGAAAAVSAISTTHRGSRVLLLPLDVQHSLIMSAEIGKMWALRQELGETSQPVAGPSLESQAVAIRYLRAVGDSDELARVQTVARGGLHDAIENMREEVGRERYQYYDSYPDEAQAARLALLAADVGDAEAAETAFGLMRAWAHRAEMANMGWDVFRGHFPRGDEMKQESDNEHRQMSQVAAHLAEAYHRAGEAVHAQTSLTKARQYAAGVRTATSRLLAFIELAEVAARCGWYAVLGEIWLELTRVRGSRLASVAEILVVTALQGGTHAAGARKAFYDILLDKSLVNVDHADILALLAVLSGSPEVETRLLAATPQR